MKNAGIVSKGVFMPSINFKIYEISKTGKMCTYAGKRRRTTVLLKEIIAKFVKDFEIQDVQKIELDMGYFEDDFVHNRQTVVISSKKRC
jgi:pyrimidine operon attenuation protein/uracil phosphoribosyltransferase